MLKLFTTAVFKVLRWRIEGEMPPGAGKCILVAGPHTSNLDFILAMAAFYKLKLPVKYLIKQEWLNNRFLRKIFINSGALGVDRSRGETMVDKMAEILINSKENLALMVSPEGTRKLVHRWKTGFYHAAMQAKVPIVLSALDYSCRVASLGPSFMPSGCYRTDMKIVRDFYSKVQARYPQQFSLQIVDDPENKEPAKAV